MCYEPIVIQIARLPQYDRIITLRTASLSQYPCRFGLLAYDAKAVSRSYNAKGKDEKRKEGLEPSTATLARWHSTIELHPQTDKEGFEPSEDIYAFSDLANRRIRPLCHLSKCVAEDLHLCCSVSDCLGNPSKPSGLSPAA